MKTDFLGLATEYPLWDGAALLAQNPIALLSLFFAIGVMFTAWSMTAAVKGNVPARIAQKCMTSNSLD